MRECQTWHTHPLKQTPTSITFAGEYRECDRLFSLVTAWVVVPGVYGGDLALSRNLSVPSSASFPPPFPSSHTLCVFIGGDLELQGCAYSTVRSVKPRYMCSLHVPERALSYWYTFYAKYRACGAGRDKAIGGGSTWTRGVAHRDCLLSDRQQSC